MKKILIFAVILCLTACDKGYLGLSGYLISGANGNLEYYTGAIPNTCYAHNYNGDRALKITGKPWMVIKYDKSTHNIIDFEFGLSEATQTEIASPGAALFPTIDASSIDYHKKLGLANPVVLLVNWPVTSEKATITNGSLGAGGVIFYYNDKDFELKWTFSYLPAGSMVGGVVMTGGYDLGVETDALNSFNMLKL